MEQNLFQAKMAILLRRQSNTNIEIVLSKIIEMSKINQGLTTSEMMKKIPCELNMSIGIYRKSIHELYKTNLIKKIDSLIYTNPDYIKL